MVIVSADSFRCVGIVIWGVVIGVMLLEIKNPAKILPSARRLIGLRRDGLFSLIGVRVWKRGWPSRVKKMMRVLYMAVREVAIKVIRRAQALV